MIRRRLTYQTEQTSPFEYAQFARYKALGLHDLTAYILSKPRNAYRLARELEAESDACVRLLRHAATGEKLLDPAVAHGCPYLRRSVLSET